MKFVCILLQFHLLIPSRRTNTTPLSLKDALRSKTGLPIVSYFSALKMVWLLDNVQGLRSKAEVGGIIYMYTTESYTMCVCPDVCLAPTTPSYIYTLFGCIIIKEWRGVIRHHRYLVDLEFVWWCSSYHGCHQRFSDTSIQVN
jgi:hypothetical protein